MLLVILLIVKVGTGVEMGIVGGVMTKVVVVRTMTISGSNENGGSGGIGNGDENSDSGSIDNSDENDDSGGIGNSDENAGSGGIDNSDENDDSGSIDNSDLVLRNVVLLR